VSASNYNKYGSAPTKEDLDVHYDVCVVGSGASGATVAWLFAQAGLSVLVIEQGGHVTEDVSYDDILAESEAAWVRQENGTWDKTGYPWTTCNVGGGTVFYGGAFFRNRPIDFNPETVLGPADLPLEWPWSYDDLDPYYTAIEYLVGVAGSQETDPTLPRRRVPYPMPAVDRSAEGNLISTGAANLGLRPFTTPLAINSRAYRGREQCIADAPCISRKCPVEAKGDAFTRFLVPAIQRGAKLFAGMKACQLLSDRARRASTLETVRVDTGQRYQFSAERFFICGNAIQTAGLLLRSSSATYPQGIGNSTDMVGRGLCFKLSEYIVGYHQGHTKQDPLALSDSGKLMGNGAFSTCAVTDYYLDDEAPGGLGGILYEARPERPYRLRSKEQIVRMEALVPDEPQRTNRIRLAQTKDAFGVPELVMDYQAHPRDLARLEYMIRKGEKILEAAGCQLSVREPSGWALGSSHLHGTCRMGVDPATSVTNPDGRLHDTDNVYIGDGALLPFPSGANPTLTIQAVALRTAHRVLESELGHDIPLKNFL